MYDALEESVNTSFLRRLSFEQTQKIRCLSIPDIPGLDHVLGRLVSA